MLLVATMLVVTLALAGCGAEPTPTATPAPPTPTHVSEAVLLCNKAAANLRETMELAGSPAPEPYGGIYAGPDPNGFTVRMVNECIRNGYLD